VTPPSFQLDPAGDSKMAVIQHIHRIVFKDFRGQGEMPDSEARRGLKWKGGIPRSKL